MGFDLGKVLGAVESRNRATTTRQAAEKKALERRQSLTKRGLARTKTTVTDAYVDGQATREGQLAILENVKATTDIAQEAMKLSDSQNPLDQLKLWALQQGDSRYTRAGNLERLNYLTKAAEVTGAVGLIRQDAYAATLGNIKDNLSLELSGDADLVEMTQLDESAANERLANTRDMLQAEQVGLAENARIQELALTKMSSPDLAASIQAADGEGANEVMLTGGVSIPIEAARARQDVLLAREDSRVLATDQRIGLTLDNMPLTQLDSLLAANPDAEEIDMGGGVKIERRLIDTARSRKLGEQDKESVRKARTNAAIQRLDNKAIESMNLAEVDNAIAEKGQFEGVVYDVNQLHKQRQSLMKQAIDDVNYKTGISDLSAPRIISEGIEAFDQLPENVVNSAFIGKSLRGVKAKLTNALSLLSESSTPEERIQAQVIVQGALEAKENLLDAEAKRLSGNNKVMETAYGYQLRGKPIPIDLITGELDKLTRKGQSLAAWLPSAESAAFNNAYRQSQVDQSVVVSGGGMATLDKNQKHAIAFDAALQALEAKQQTQTVEALLGAQVGAGYGNPLEGLVSAQTILSIQKESDDKGIARYNEVSGNTIPRAEMTKEQQLEFDNGVGALQMSYLLEELDSIEPNLGARYAEWWASDKRREFTAGLMQGMISQNANSFTGSVKGSLAAADGQNTGAGLAQVIQAGLRMTQTDERQARIDAAMNFNGSQANRQMFLLDVNRELSAQDKLIAAEKIVMPILGKMSDEMFSGGSARGDLRVSDKFNNRFDQLLTSTQFEDSTVRRVQQMMLSGSPEANKTLESFWVAQKQANASRKPATPPRGIMTTDVIGAGNAIKSIWGMLNLRQLPNAETYAWMKPLMNPDY